MLRAILFDCDGVIVDTEPVHFELFREVLAEEGIALTEEEYYREYVGMTDKECFGAALSKAGKIVGEPMLRELVQKKHALFTQVLPQKLVAYPATLDLIQQARERYLLGVVSGALREEILLILNSLKINSVFKVIVSAEDVPLGKPDPAGYRLGLERLGVSAEEAIGIEDTPAGIEAVQSAGMRCVAISNVFEAPDLSKADGIFRKGEPIALAELGRLCQD